jgi:hypothetical protein
MSMEELKEYIAEKEAAKQEESSKTMDSAQQVICMMRDHDSHPGLDFTGH